MKLLENIRNLPKAASPVVPGPHFRKILLVLSGLLITDVVAGPPPTDWKFLLPSTVLPNFHLELFDVAHGNGTFVGVGGFGGVATSPDGVNWTPVLPGTFDYFGSVAFGNGIFVAGGWLTSPWRGAQGIHTSTNGLEWDLHLALPDTDGIYQIRFLGGTFFATGDEYLPDGRRAGVLFTSTNGTEWTRRLRLLPPGDWDNAYLREIVDNNGNFIVTGSYDRTSVDNSEVIYLFEHFTFTSTNGGEWTQSESSPVLPLQVGTHFFAGLYFKVDGHRLLSSADGVAWEVSYELEGMDEAEGSWSWRLAVSGDRIVAIVTQEFLCPTNEEPAPENPPCRWHTEGFPRVALSSGDGISWQQAPLPPNVPGDSTWKLFAHDGSFFYLGERSALSSPDGITWKEHFTPDPLDADTAGLRGVAYGGEGFVAVGANGTILGSRDGLDWERRESGTEQNLTDVIYGGGRYVAAGEGGTLIYSTNGIVWTQAALEGNTLSLGYLAYGAGRFVLLTRVGNNGFFWTSNDGVNWQLRFSDALIFINGANSIASGNGRFVVLGDVVAISEDGITWQRSIVPGRDDTLIFDGERFLSHDNGFSNSLRSSPDGLTWTDIPNYLISAIGYGDGNLVALRSAEENQTAYGPVVFILESSIDGASWTTVAPFRFFKRSGNVDLKFAYGSGRFVGVGETNGTARLLVSGFTLPLTFPRLDVLHEANQLMLRIRGNAGSQWNVQRSSTLQEWETVGPITLGTEPLEIDVTPSTGSRGFWRLSTP